MIVPTKFKHGESFGESLPTVAARTAVIAELPHNRSCIVALGLPGANRPSNPQNTMSI